MAVDFQRVQEIFVAAVECADSSSRVELLDRECGQDDELRRRVDMLLAAHDDAASLPRPILETDLFEHQSGLAGTIIADRYKLLEQIGEGGMGTVWVAEQSKPVKRKVAVKLIKAGMDSRSVLARFDAERQALAIMDHPNIARVLDGGLTDDQRPFFVMEHVRGVPITEYCDSGRLGVRERLKLFAQVCSAVQHAHQKGIIHRDLKPSNILVAPYDDRPVPKVIDFGLAKAMHQSLTDLTLYTHDRSVLGTPLYMSPEQSQLNNIDIDTRSDIYSLGVLLYELLTGTTPLQKQRFQEAAWDEVGRIIREEEPPRPSARLSSTEMLPSLAACRQSEPHRLTKLVRGELDWIVMKALDKDRARRYETANGFASDVERYLAGEPVWAAPPSIAYRMRKFVRLNRGKVLAVGLVLLTLLIGIAGTTWGMFRAQQFAKSEREARQEANTERGNALKAAHTARTALAKEQKERQYAQAIADFVSNDVLALSSPEGQERFAGIREEMLDPNLTVRQMLDRAAEKLAARHDLDPRIEAQLCWMIGVNYRVLGDLNTAIPFLEKSRTLRLEAEGAVHDETLIATNSLAVAYARADRLTDAIAILEPLTDIWKQEMGLDDPRTLAVLDNLRQVYQDAGRLREAIQLGEQIASQRESILGPHHPDTIITQYNMALAYQDSDQLPRAIQLLELVRNAEVQTIGTDHLDTLTTSYSLALAYKQDGRLTDAIDLLEEVRDGRVSLIGFEHDDTVATLKELAIAYWELGRMTDVVDVLEHVEDAQVNMRGPDDLETVAWQKNLALAYRDAGRLPESIELGERVRDKYAQFLDVDHPLSLTARANLATSYYLAGRTDEAIAIFETVREAQRNTVGDRHPDTLTTTNNLALAYRDNGQMDRAIKLFETVRDLRIETLGAEHTDTLSVQHDLAMAYFFDGRPSDAIELLEPIRDDWESTLGLEHPDTMMLSNDLAMAYMRVDRIDDAIELFEQVLDYDMKHRGVEHPGTLVTMNNLANAHAIDGDFAAALPFFEDASLGMEKLGFQHLHAGRIVNGTINAYMQAGEIERAEGWQRKWLQVVRQRAGPESTEYAGQLAVLSMQLVSQNKWEEAESVLRDCLAVRQSSQPDDWTTFNTMSLLGGVLLERESFEVAETLLIKGYEGMKQRSEEIPPQIQAERLTQAVDRLIELYTQTGREDDAEQWKQEREEIKGTGVN